MGIRRPTKRVGVCAFAATGYLLTLLRGQSRQVHVPVPTLVLLPLLVKVIVIVFARGWYMYHYSSKPV